MKQRKHIFLLPAAVIFLITMPSCETTIDYKGKEAEPKTVVYAVLNPDSLISVSVAESHSVFLTDYQPRQITDAVVKVYRDGVLLETLVYTAPGTLPDYAPENPLSLYVSAANKPEFGKTYRIEVEVPGLPKVYGETVLPVPVAVAITDTSSSSIGYGQRELVVRMRFRDPAGVKNYYRFTASGVMGYYYGDKSMPYDPSFPVNIQRQDLSYGAVSDPLISPQQEDDIFDMYLQNVFSLFLDELIPGKEYSLKVTYAGMYPNTDYYEFLRAALRLNSLTRDLYLHLQSYSAYNQSRDNFLAEPVPVYTNVVNGLGVIGAMSASTDSLKIGEYPVEGVNYDMWLY